VARREADQLRSAHGDAGALCGGADEFGDAIQRDGIHVGQVARDLHDPRCEAQPEGADGSQAPVTLA